MTLDAVRKTRCVGGLVHPGPDWIKPALPEGSTDAQAFVLPGGITKIDGRNATANVAWPLLAEDDPNAVVARCESACEDGRNARFCERL